MGCFSFLCKECGEPIRSDDEAGEHVHLYLLRHGEIIEELQGQYDSYGRVLNEEGESELWDMDWSKICELMDDKKSTSGEGIAAIHSDCFRGLVPITKSEGDPNQGWGEVTHSTSEII